MPISLFSFKQTTIARPDHFPLRVVFGQEPCARLSPVVAHPPSKRRQLLSIPFQRLNRLIPFEAESVFQLTQKLVAPA